MQPARCAIPRCAAPSRATACNCAVRCRAPTFAILPCAAGFRDRASSLRALPVRRSTAAASAAAASSICGPWARRFRAGYWKSAGRSSICAPRPRMRACSIRAASAPRLPDRCGSSRTGSAGRLRARSASTGPAGRWARRPTICVSRKSPRAKSIRLPTAIRRWRPAGPGNISSMPRRAAGSMSMAWGWTANGLRTSSCAAIRPIRASAGGRKWFAAITPLPEPASN